MNGYNTYYNNYYNQIPNYNLDEYIKKGETRVLRRQSNGLGFFILGYFFTMNLLAIVIMVIYELFKVNIEIDPFAEYLLDIAASVGAVLIPGSVFLAVSSHRLSSGYSKTFVKPSVLIPVTLMGMGVSMIANYAADLFDRNISIFGLENSVSMSADSALKVPEIILYVIAVAIVPAFAEEFAFRGIALGLLRKYGNAFAILVTSIMFGAMHGNTTQIVFAFILGLIFGYVDVITDSIVPSIIIHFLNNFYAVLTDILNTNSNINDRELYLIYLGIIVMFCVSGLLSFVYLARRDKSMFSISERQKPSRQSASVLTFKEKLKAFFINPGIIICLCLFTSEMIYYLIPQEALNYVLGR